MLSSHTSTGRLYETDLRLRPNGASGLLVSTVAAFDEYQRSQAWVWEHQALTRARFSAGDTEVGAAFERIRQEVLCQARDLDALRREILSMRRKMLDGHPNDTGLFDIKHDRGGMVDIEFIVQYLVLAHAHAYPQLTANVGNLALLKLAGGCASYTARCARPSTVCASTAQRPAASSMAQSTPEPARNCGICYWLIGKANRGRPSYVPTGLSVTSTVCSGRE